MEMSINYYIGEYSNVIISYISALQFLSRLIISKIFPEKNSAVLNVPLSKKLGGPEPYP